MGVERGKKLLNDTILYSIAQFGSRMLIFLMLPLYTHYFSPDEFGLWDLTLTTIAFMTPFISMEMIAAVYRWLLDARTYARQQQIIATGSWMIGRNMIVFNSLAVILLLTIHIPYGWLALLVINTDILSNFAQQITRGLMRNRLFASLGILHALVFVSTILVLIFIFHVRIEAFFYATALANLFVLATATWRTRMWTYVWPSFRTRELIKPMLTYALPIIPGAMSWWVISLADRYFISIYLGTGANGIYAVAAKIPAVLMLLNNVFALAWKDSAIQTFAQKEKDTYFTDVFTLFFKGLCTAVIGILLISKLLMILFIGEAYIDAWKYGNILVLGALFHACALFWAAGFHGAKQTKPIFTSAMTGAIISIIGNVLFIPFFGLYAVATTSTISFLIVWIMRIRQARGVFRIRIKATDVLLFMVMGAIAFPIPFVVSMGGLVGVVVVAGVFFAFLWWRDVQRVWKYVKKTDSA